LTDIVFSLILVCPAGGGPKGGKVPLYQEGWRGVFIPLFDKEGKGEIF